MTTNNTWKESLLLQPFTMDDTINASALALNGDILEIRELAEQIMKMKKISTLKKAL